MKQMASDTDVLCEEELRHLRANAEARGILILVSFSLFHWQLHYWLRGTSRNMGAVLVSHECIERISWLC